jgi:hypothetical protein
MTGTTLRAMGVVVGFIMTTSASAAERTPWPDTFAGRLETQALLETLNADLLAHDSATLTIERWCADHRLADPARIVAERVKGADKPASPEVRAALVSNRTNRSAIVAFGSSAATMCSPRLTIGTSQRGSRPR